MNHILTKLDFGDGHGAQDASCEGGGQKYALSQLTELFQRKIQLVYSQSRSIFNPKFKATVGPSYLLGGHRQ